MSGSTTRSMISVYIQQAAPTLFLSGLFQSPPQNFHTTEEVEIDIVRSDEDIAIVVQDLSTGSRMNSEDLYTNKSFKPPIFDESFPVNSWDLIKRSPGENPFQQPDFRANVITRLFNGMTKIERKIRRAAELQASQVLQTGIVTLTDSAGTALYTLDYKPKSSHFPTAGNAWGGGSDTPLDDISALAEIIRNDGLEDPDQLIMGVDAFTAFIANSDVQAHFDIRRIDQGTISGREMRGNGGSFRGIVIIGNYTYDVWTYGGRFKDPQTGNKLQFLDPSKVIVRSSTGRLDATFGAVPNIGALLGATAGNLLPELPGRISNVDGGMDMSVKSWLSQDGAQLFGGVAARPLYIPTAIDTYGCLETNA